MKALVLAGGSGVRLRPFTHTYPKQLIPVANKPVLFTVLEQIKDAGITDVGMIVGDTSSAIQAAVGDGVRWGLRVTYIQQDKPRGLAHAVIIAEAFLGDSPFVMFLGDNLLQCGIKPFVEQFLGGRSNALLMLSEVVDPRRYGIAVTNGYRVIRVLEKPVVPVSNLAIVGVYAFDNHIVHAARAIRPSSRGELEITDAIQWLIDHDRDVTSRHIEGWWKDVGTLDALLDANHAALQKLQPSIEGFVSNNSQVLGPVSIGPGTTIVNSLLLGPVSIGADCVVQNATIGPYASVASGCTIIGSSVEQSLILEPTSLVSAQIGNGVLGQNVWVPAGSLEPAEVPGHKPAANLC